MTEHKANEVVLRALRTLDARLRAGGEEIARRTDALTQENAKLAIRIAAADVEVTQLKSTVKHWRERAEARKAWIVDNCRPRMCGCYEEPDVPCACGARDVLSDETQKERE